MSTRRMSEIISAIHEIEHVKIIRLGSKMPAFDPFRILNDPELQDLLRTHSTREKRIYLMAHFDHPRELTDVAKEGLAKYIECGVICVQPSPPIRGINATAHVRAEMCSPLSTTGRPPYSLFH